MAALSIFVAKKASRSSTTQVKRDPARANGTPAARPRVWGSRSDVAGRGSPAANGIEEPCPRRHHR